MGVSVTDNMHVALFDNTTGMTFGSIFDDEQSAQEFLEWLKEGESNNLTFKFKGEDLLFVEDPRKYRPAELDKLQSMWTDERNEEVRSGD